MVREKRLEDREYMFMLENEYNQIVGRVMNGQSNVESFDVPMKDGDKTVIAECTFFKEPSDEHRNIIWYLYIPDDE